MAKTTNNDVMPLADSWKPPSIVPGTDRGPGHPLVCLATTYTFNAELLETELLPRFLGLKFDQLEREPAFLVEREDKLENITAAVLADQSQIDNRQTTLRWDQVAVRVPRAIQHAKVVLLVWERMVRLIVGSANLSISGYRHNREIVGVLDFFDDPGSVPRVVLHDALNFLKKTLSFAVAERRVLARVASGIDATVTRVRKWGRTPSEFTPREYPRAHFTVNLPNAEGGVSASVLKQVKELWGEKTATDIRVVTPFVGNPESQFQRLVSELAEVPHNRSLEVKLAVPGVKSEADSSHGLVMLPRAFRDAWAGAWGHDETELDVCVVVPETAHKARTVERPLHAKGIFISNSHRSLLCCGSSNFSVSGMGLGRANIEANLVYLDRSDSDLDDGCLENRLPVDWDRDRAREVTWPSAPEVSEEDQEMIGTTIPCVFLWAIFNPTSSVLRVALEVDHPLPTSWSIRLPHGSSPILASNDLYPSMPPDGGLTIQLPSELSGFPVTTLQVRWLDGENEETAVIPVQVADRKSLPPPEGLRSLTAEAILACILSGCSPAEWLDREIDRKTSGIQNAPSDPELDPHRLNDPSGLALYRVRRLGRGLSAMGQRLVKTVRTPEAVDYQLNRHPLGPVCLTDAMLREAGASPTGMSKIDRARIVFSLLEVGLMMAHAGKQLNRLRQAGEADHRACFRRAVDRVLSNANRLMTSPIEGDGTGVNASNSLLTYHNSVYQQASELLGGLNYEEEQKCP